MTQTVVLVLERLNHYKEFYRISNNDLGGKKIRSYDLDITYTGYEGNNYVACANDFTSIDSAFVSVHNSVYTNARVRVNHSTLNVTVYIRDSLGNGGTCNTSILVIGN